MKLEEFHKIVVYYWENPKTIHSVRFLKADNTLHFADGPAYMNSSGYKQWRVQGKLIKDNYKEAYPDET